MNKGPLIGIIAAAVVLAVLLVLNLKPLEELVSGKPAVMITATVKLINKCPMPNDVFILKAVKSGKSASFKSGVAQIKVLEGSKLQLNLSKSYPEVKFSGPKVSAAKEISITADCAESERIGNTMKSFGKTFDKD
jgi:hypothetical protein